jgi:pectinesterase
MKSGLVIQNCRLVPDQKLFPDRFKIPSYLGRPWKEFSRLVIMESTIADFVKPEGYMPWNGDFGLKTLYYAEYNNRGPGAGTSKRVNWPGFRVIGRQEAQQFTAGPFIDGATWLRFTGTPHFLGFKS